MVAVIKSTNSIKNALHYNENKLQQQVTQLIHSSGFGKDTEQLGFADKIRILEKLISLNERTKLNAVHIYLNFDASEKILVEKFRAITDTYMDRIAFGNQPYLVYQHHNAGHPHQLLSGIITYSVLEGSPYNLLQVYLQSFIAVVAYNILTASVDIPIRKVFTLHGTLVSTL